MKTTTYEAVVENGQVHLPEDAYIPENTKVYVVVPSGEITTSVRLASPRLAHRERDPNLSSGQTPEQIESQN